MGHTTNTFKLQYRENKTKIYKREFARFDFNANHLIITDIIDPYGYSENLIDISYSIINGALYISGRKVEIFKFYEDARLGDFSKWYNRWRTYESEIKDYNIPKEKILKNVWRYSWYFLFIPRKYKLIYEDKENEYNAQMYRSKKTKPFELCVNPYKLSEV